MNKYIKTMIEFLNFFKIWMKGIGNEYEHKLFMEVPVV